MSLADEVFASGNKLYEQQHYQAAMQLFRQLIDLVPPDDHKAAGRAHYSVGQCLFALGQYDDAEASFRAALAVDPELDRASKRLAEIATRRAATIPPSTTSQPGGGLVGVVRQLRRTTESHAWIARTQTVVLSFRVEPAGQSGRSVAVEMRGPQIRGSIEEGDTVALPKGTRPGKSVTSLVNMTTGETVRVRGGTRRLQWLILGAFLVAFAAFAIWVASSMTDDSSQPDATVPATGTIEDVDSTTSSSSTEPTSETTTTEETPTSADVTTDGSTTGGETPVDGG